MLSAACRRFRVRFVPGSSPPHRKACAECEAFAAALESAAGLRLPLPEALRKNLRAVAAPAPGAALPFPVPRVPLPDGLARRLREIAPARRPAPPAWVLSPRYALAASALLALLLGPFLAGAAHQGLRALGAVHAEMSPLLQRTEESGSAELRSLRSAAATAYGAARRSAETSLKRLDAGIAGLSRRLYDAVPPSLIDQGPERETPGPVRRAQ